MKPNRVFLWTSCPCGPAGGLDLLRRRHMIAYQLSIFAENKPGVLARITGVLAKAKISIRATTISTSDTFGVISLIVDDPQRAKTALTEAGMTVHLRSVLAVLIPDRPGGLDNLVQLALSGGHQYQQCLWLCSGIRGKGRLCRGS